MTGEDEISLRLTSTLGGRYEIFEEFAAGGIASVHLARYRTGSGITRLVAIKRLHGHHAKDAEFRAALLDEARFASRIDHPNAVGVIDVVDDGDELVLVMDYVHGTSLSKLTNAQAGRQLEPAIAATILAGALKGLHAAHEIRGDDGKCLDLIHRDVSPQNILVGSDGIPRVIDFGLAHAIGRAAFTKTGEVKGKPSYMSPEQVRGEPLTRASDVFSAGIVLWNALTGRRLFGEGRLESILYQILQLPIPAPSTLVPTLSRALDAAVMRALERDPARRFPTALAMARAIEAAERPLPVGVIGEWVQEAASEWLGEMSGRIKRIELTSDRPPPLGTTDRVSIVRRSSSTDLTSQVGDDGPTLHDEDTAETTAPIPTPPSTFVATGPSFQPAPPSRGSSDGARLVAIGAVLFVGIGIAFVVGRGFGAHDRSSSPATVAASASAPASAAAAAPAVIANVPDVPSAPLPRPQSPPPIASAPPSVKAAVDRRVHVDKKKPAAPAPRPSAKPCADMFDPRCR